MTPPPTLFKSLLTCAFALLVSIIISTNAGAQSATKDTANSVEIIIRNAGSYIGVKTDTAQLTKFIGDVHLSQGTSDVYCDSAYIDMAKNNVEAFGNVRIVQPGTQVQSDYLRYVGNQKQAFLRDNVQLTDGHSTLNSSDLTYNLGTKIAHYDNSGTLQTDATTVSSNTGTYNVTSKDARFKGNVLVTDPQYNVTSEDLGWNTESKVVKFYSASVVTNDKSMLHTNGGMYDTKREVAHFYRPLLHHEQRPICGGRQN